MSRYYYITAIFLCVATIIYVIIFNKNNMDTLIYTDRDSKENNKVISETSYIPDSQSKSTFFVCKTRKIYNYDKSSCKKINGIKHGVQRWYDDGNLKYEDFYNYGNKTQTITYYSNGLKNKECVFDDGRIKQQNFYSNSAGNQLVETIFYKGREKVKKYFKNNKIYKEEKYINDKLVSRKVYDSDGLLQRLEEYNFIDNLDGFDNFFDGFDFFSPYPFESPNDERYKDTIPDNMDKQHGIWI